jgi:hypothetical protein
MDPEAAFMVVWSAMAREGSPPAPTALGIIIV